MHILIIEDEEQLCRSVAEGLRIDGYETDICFDGDEGLCLCMTENYDLILLDLNLPGTDGLEILRQFREHNTNTPVLILSARDQIEDKVNGLDLGANDYLTKPFDTKELLARIRAMTRSANANIHADSSMHVGNITLDTASYELSSPSGSYKLANKEYQMMEMMMANPKQLISTERFMEKIWGYDSEAEINVVWVYISYLRKKLEALNADIQIKATRNAGYSLEEKAGRH